MNINKPQPYFFPHYKRIYYDSRGRITEDHYNICINMPYSIGVQKE